MDFLSQRWYLCDKEVISSICKSLKETRVHREEASAGKTCLQAGVGSFYPPSKLFARRDAWNLQKKQHASQGRGLLGAGGGGVRCLFRERPRADVGRWRLHRARQRGIKPVLNSGELPQEGAQSPRAGSPAGCGAPPDLRERSGTGPTPAAPPEAAAHPSPPGRGFG